MNDMPRFSAAELAQLTAAELAELQAHLELIHLDEMGRNVTTYAKHMEVPGAPVLGEEGQFYPVRLQVMAHHKLILDAAQELIDGPAEGEEAYDGLIIMQPPGSAKSTYGNVVLSSWLLGQKNQNGGPMDIISTSYGSDLAEGFSRRVRSMVNSPMWTKIFGGAVADSAIGNWSTTLGSAYRCGGILSGITGKRADCLPGNTSIDTPKGKVQLDKIVIGDYVLSYDKELCKTVHRRVLAIARRDTNELWRIRTASGRVVEATGNHRFHTARGWCAASSIAMGDVLLRAVPSAEAYSSLRGSEGQFAPQVLRPSLRDEGIEPRTWNVRQYLQWVRQAGHESAKLFARMSLGYFQSSSAKDVEISGIFPNRVPGLRRLRDILQASVQCHAEPLLLDGVQKCWSLGLDEGYGKRQLAARQGRQRQKTSAWDVWSDGVQESTREGVGQGWQQMPFLRLLRSFAGTSYRSESVQSRGRKHRDALRPLPLDASCGFQGWAIDDQVVGVERTSKQCAVYDIQVEGTACFFANEILVHNCLIIDDPVKGREEADSEIIRNKIFAAWQDDLNTRMKPGGKVVIIGTRWHEDDLIGRLLGTKWEGQSGLWIGTDQRRWYVICLPMIAEHADDPLGRPIGAMLWPEWFREREVKRIRDTSERTWSALYQQRPSATQGNILKADWWKCWPHGKSKPTEKQLDEVERGMDGECVDADKIFMTFLSYDTAFAEGEENDYSAMTAWHAFYTNVKVRPNTYGESKDREKMLNLILAGGWQGKVDTPDLREIVKSHVRIMKPDFILIENKASGIGLIQELRRARIGTQIIAWTPRGVPGTRGKTPRAHQASYTLSTGAVWYVAGKQTASVIKNCAAFPHAAHDDWCDTVTQAILYARDTGLQEIDSDAQTPEEMEEMALAKNNSHKRTLYGARPETTGKPKDWNPENRTLYGGRRQ